MTSNFCQCAHSIRMVVNNRCSLCERSIAADPVMFCKYCNCPTHNCRCDQATLSGTTDMETRVTSVQIQPLYNLTNTTPICLPSGQPVTQLNRCSAWRMTIKVDQDMVPAPQDGRRDLLLVIDRSGSMGIDKAMTAVIKSVIRFITDLFNTNLSIIVFNHTAEILWQGLLPEQSTDALIAVQNIKADGGTDYDCALDLANQLIKKGLTHVYLFTDGLPRNTPSDKLDHTLNNAHSVEFVGLGDNASANLRKLVLDSNTVTQLKTYHDLETMFDKFRKRIGQRCINFQLPTGYYISGLPLTNNKLWLHTRTRELTLLYEPDLGARSPAITINQKTYAIPACDTMVLDACASTALYDRVAGKILEAYRSKRVGKGHEYVQATKLTLDKLGYPLTPVQLSQLTHDYANNGDFEVRGDDGISNGGLASYKRRPGRQLPYDGNKRICL